MGQASAGHAWSVWRRDDNGNEFLVQGKLTEQEARRLVHEFEAKGHKQSYWAQPGAELGGSTSQL